LPVLGKNGLVNTALLGAGVVANAVSAALASLNVEVKELPLSPPKIWRLIQDAKRSRSAD